LLAERDKESIMADLISWEKDSTRKLQREIADLLDEFRLPRGFRREMDRVFDDFGSVRPLWREMDRLLDDFESPPTLRRRIAGAFERFIDGLRHPFARAKKALSPAVSLDEHDDEILVRVDLTGVKEEDVDVRVEGRVLTIRAERREEETKHVRGTEYTERTHDSFSRSLELPPGTDTTKVEADFEGGGLTVRIPKVAEARGRRIPITQIEMTSPAPTNGPAAKA
jgi:HSP20 family protein